MKYKEIKAIKSDDNKESHLKIDSEFKTIIVQELGGLLFWIEKKRILIKFSTALKHPKLLRVVEWKKISGKRKLN